MAEGSGRVPVLLWPVFFVSGAAGLMYQVIWMRHAALHLGGSNVAVGTVVATFLTGLALGSGLGGRWMDRAVGKRGAAFAAVTYAVLELGIAAWGLLFEPALSAATPLAGALYAGDTSPWFNLARIGLCAALILPPTVAMGATLPILARFAATWAADPARATGRLYAVNTFGAVAGALAAGLLALPWLGLFGSTLVAVGLNVVVAAGALVIARTRLAPAPAMEGEAARLPAWILQAYAVSGFAALVYELAWTRGLVLALGSSVYAFSVTLACFIFGIALGSAIATRLGPRIHDVVGVFALLQLGTAVLAAATVPLLQNLPVWMVELTGGTGAPIGILWTAAGLAALTMLPPTLLIGGMFPLLLRIAIGTRDGAGRAVGRLYAWNTAGNILGTLSASFLLLPWLGVRGAILVGALLNLGVAALALTRHTSTGGLWTSPLIPLVLAPALFLVPRWDEVLVTTQPILYGGGFLERSRAEGVPLRDILRANSTIVFSRWDAGALVTVHDARNADGTAVRTLKINGKSDASTGGDMATQLLIAHVPMLLHPDPQEVLVVGLGSGASLAAALSHPLAHADCIEISPAVAEAATLFGDQLGHPLDDARATVHITDARSHLRFSDTRYDVIASEPSNLWIRGMATLFTVEHFQQIRDRLEPGGIASQWVHAYRLPSDDFAAVLRSFQTVFPNSALWEIGVGADYLLVGFTGGLPAWETVDRRYRRPAVRRNLERWGLPSLEAVMRGWILGDEGIAAFAGDAPLITDDFTWVEYSAALGMLSGQQGDLIDKLQPAREVLAPTLAGGPDLHAFRYGRALLAGAYLKDVAGELYQQLYRLDQARPYAAADPAFQTGAEQLALQVRVTVPLLVDRGQTREALLLLELVQPGTSVRPWAEEQIAGMRGGEEP